MSDVVRITECRLCDSPNLELVVSFNPTPIGDHYVTEFVEQPCYPLDVLVCQTCGAVQLADTVDPKLIYPDTYLYTTSTSKGLDAHFRRYAKRVVERCGPGLVLDIGSNDGTLLKVFQEFGCRVVGVEPSEAIRAKAMSDEIPTHLAFFTEAFAREYRRADTFNLQPTIITANHVFANVADLHDFTKGVKHLLAPEGTFVFETGYWPEIVNHNLIDTIEHEHIHYFAVKPLRQFFQRHGLTLVHVEINDAKGGSLRGYVQHAGVSQADSTVFGLSAKEHAEGCADIGCLGIWVDELKALEQDMRAKIADSGDEIWVGYGAAVGSTILCHQFGLGEKLLCLVDTNPNKQGRLSPGYHLRVEDPSALDALKPDSIVILAWRYAEMIQRQHPEFKGKFILPLPELVHA